MNKQILNIEGQIFNRITVLSFCESKDGRAFWKCLCFCGREFETSGKSLRTGHTTSCGCYARQQASKRASAANGSWVKLPDNQGQVNEIYKSYKGDAKRRNLTFNLTKERFRELIMGSCYYSGHSDSNCRKYSKAKYFTYNGIDRLDNSIGYEQDNVVSCCKNCNLAKRALSKKEFLMLIKTIYEKLELHQGVEHV